MIEVMIKTKEGECISKIPQKGEDATWPEIGTAFVNALRGLGYIVDDLDEYFQEKINEYKM